MLWFSVQHNVRCRYLWKFGKVCVCSFSPRSQNCVLTNLADVCCPGKSHGCCLPVAGCSSRSGLAVMWVSLEESGSSSSGGLVLCEECGGAVGVGMGVKEGRPRRTVRRASSRLEDRRSSWERLLGAVGRQDNKPEMESNT